MKHRKKGIILLASLAVLFMVGVTGTLAYLITQTSPVTNTFVAGNVDTSVEESFDGETKSNVRISNDGIVDAYIRAKVIVNWIEVDSNNNPTGNIYSAAPVKCSHDISYTHMKSEECEYSIIFDTSEEWIEGSDGYYYWPEPVSSNGLTGNLIDTCKVLKSGPKENYALSVEILSQAIQADGTTTTGTPAVVDAWNVTMNGNKITGVNTGN